MSQTGRRPAVNGVLSRTRSADDPRLVAALEVYLDAVEQGRAPERRAFLADYPDIATELARCLEGLAELRQRKTRGSRMEDRESRIEDRESRIEGAGTTALRQRQTQRSGDRRSSILDPRSSILDLRSSDFFRTVANLGVQAAEAL